MYINFWYPIAKSEEITAEKPLKIEILSLNFELRGFSRRSRPGTRIE
jgi:hypothetical protein